LTFLLGPSHHERTVLPQALLAFLEGHLSGPDRLKRLRRMLPAEFAARLAEVATKPHGDAPLTGFEPIVPSAAYEEVLDEYANRMNHGPAKPRR
jgi:hypothetical protein